MSEAVLYLIPAPISDSPVETVIPPGNLKILASLRFFIVEELKTARRFLIKAGIKPDFTLLNFRVFNEHTTQDDLSDFLEPIVQGNSVGLLSEAGVPCIADPGSLIVKTAHEKQISVVPLTGPSSIILALMASGFNGQNFIFHGYLPAEKDSRNKKLKEIDLVTRQLRQTQIFIEAPYRNLQLFEAITNICHAQTLLCIATDITGTQEKISTRTIGQWKKNPPDIHKKNSIYLLFHP